jgi:hypothetical protein
MTVQEIYERYRIMPGLQLHQLRVAAVAQIICENSLLELDTESVVLACLFHDMANIIKSDLALFPELLEPDGAAHWEIVRREFIDTYGTNEHKAAQAIAKEIGLPAEVRSLMDGIGFSNLERIRDAASYEQKIAEYCDLRVGPHGVLSMAARLEEARIRYSTKHHENNDIPHTEDEYARLRAAAFDIEQQIFADGAIAPDDITEVSVTPRFDALRAQRIA